MSWTMPSAFFAFLLNSLRESPAPALMLRSRASSAAPRSMRATCAVRGSP
jgi:hypothetical protein